MKAIVFLGLGNNLITHGSRSSSSHSTAFFSNVLKTVSTLLTVFGARSASASFSRCTYSFVIASRRFEPSVGTRCHFKMDSIVAMPLGLWRFARA